MVVGGVLRLITTSTCEPESLVEMLVARVNLHLIRRSYWFLNIQNNVESGRRNKVHMSELVEELLNVYENRDCVTEVSGNDMWRKGVMSQFLQQTLSPARSVTRLN